MARIARRVSEGGHDVPEADVRRRFDRSLANLPGYAAHADIWRVFDVSRRNVRVAAEGLADCVASMNADAAVPQSVTQWVSRLPPCSEY